MTPASGGRPDFPTTLRAYWNEVKPCCRNLPAEALLIFKFRTLDREDSKGTCPGNISRQRQARRRGSTMSASRGSLVLVVGAIMAEFRTNASVYWRMLSDRTWP